MTNKSFSKENFMAAFLDATQPLEESDKRVFNHVTIELMPQTGKPGFEMGEQEVYLSDMNADVLHKGFGTAAMNMLTSLADKHGIHIVLHASAYDDRDEAPETGDLIDFYKRYGFFRCGPNYEMTRTPSGPDATP